MRSSHDVLQDDVTGDTTSHLRAVIERQPVALARVGQDGMLLAVNETAMPMLGADALQQVLGTSLATFVAPEQQESFHSFLMAAAAGSRGSVEVDLVGLSGQSHALDVRASRHPGAPDGLASSLLTFHDVTARRRLEHALEGAAQLLQQEDAPSREQLQDLEHRFEALQSEKRELLASSALLQVEARFQRHRVDDQSSRLEALESSRAQALATAQVLQAALDEQQEQTAELTTRLYKLADERREAVESAERLREQLEAAQAQSNELSSRVEQLERPRELEPPASAPEPVCAVESPVEVASLTVHIADLEARHATQISELAAAHAARLATMLETLTEHQRAHEQRVSDIEREHATRIADLESKHAEHSAELEGDLRGTRSALAEAIAGTEAAVAAAQQAEAAFSAERLRLEGDWRAAVESDREARQALAAATASQEETERSRKSLLQAISRLAEEAKEQGR